KSSDAIEKCKIGNYNEISEKKNRADEIEVKRDGYKINTEIKRLLGGEALYLVHEKQTRKEKNFEKLTANGSGVKMYKVGDIRKDGKYMSITETINSKMDNSLFNPEENISQR
ncbi:8679_t:CDS:2, partial [Gigaspora rosea]